MKSLLPGTELPPSQIEQEFHQLAELWRTETGMHSSISKQVQHPAYRQIIDMGEKALPLILRELRERPAHWFSALRAIAKESPVPEGDRTNFEKTKAAWLRWGKDRGLID